MQTSAARTLRWVALGFALLMIAAFVVGSASSSSKDIGVPTAPASGAAGPWARTQSNSGTGESALTGSAAGVVERSAEALGDDAPAPLPNFGDRIVRSADLAIEVKEGRFDEAWRRANAIAGQFGGQVLSSSRGDGTRPVGGESASQIPSGDITIRVPSERLDAALAAMRALGDVHGDTLSSQDVTQEYTDLRSRLRHERAEEAVLLRLFARARSISDTLEIQNRLSEVQQRIEELTGRIRYLDGRTEFSTIALHLAEPGAAFATEQEPSFARAWRTAVDGLVLIGTGTMIAAMWIAPFAAVALAALALRRRSRARAEVVTQA